MGKDLRGNGISRRNSQLNINGALNGAPTKRATAKNLIKLRKIKGDR